MNMPVRPSTVTAAKPRCARCSKVAGNIQVKTGGRQYHLCDGCYDRWCEVREKAQQEAAREFLEEGK